MREELTYLLCFAHLHRSKGLLVCKAQFRAWLKETFKGGTSPCGWHHRGGLLTDEENIRNFASFDLDNIFGVEVCGKR